MKVLSLLICVFLLQISDGFAQKKKSIQPKVKTEKDSTFGKRKTLIKRTEIGNNKNQKDTLRVKIGRVLCSMKGTTGWIKNNNSKWISSPNRIPFEEDDLNSEYYEKSPLGNDNLNEIAIAEVSIKGKNYYALLLYDVKGYDLDVKKEDDLTWKNFPCVEYYVFPKSELKNIRLDSLKAGGKFTQSIQYLFYGAFNNSIPQNLNFEMKRHIEWNIVQDHPKESKTDAYFQFFLNPVKLKTGATVLRFNITMIYPPIGEKPKRTIDYRVFTYQFYEVPFEKWKQFVVSLPKK